MKITLYRAFPDPYRQSMTFYADQLSHRLQDFQKQGDETRSYLPRNIFTQPRLLRYGSQYLFYQCMASFAQGDVNHVIDHAYGHLIHAMDPRKTVVTFHDAMRLKAHGLNGATTSRGWLQVYNLNGIRKAAKVIFPSEASREEFLKLVKYPMERTVVIPIGLEEEFFETGAGNVREGLGLGAGYYILHVGHTGNYKNINALFHVLAKIKAQGHDVKLLKTGMEFTDEQLRLARELKVNEQIVHLGLVDREVLPQIYRAADVLLFPSYDEGFGIPVVEAMASGIPVVASNGGALPEVVRDAGVLKEPDDHDGMAEAILRLKENQGEREKLIALGRKRAEKYFISEVVKKTYHVYEKIHEEVNSQ